MANPADFGKTFAALRAQYVSRLPDKLAELESSFACVQATPADRELLRTFHRQAHSLTGSGASYGYPELSRTARILETALKQAMQSPADMTAGDFAQIRQQLDAVSQAASAGAAPEAAPTPAAAPASASAGTAMRRLALLEKDEAPALALAAQLAHFDYAVDVFRTPESLFASLGDSQAEALLLDVAGPDEVAALLAITTYAGDAGIPLIFASEDSELPTRLAAVRAGGAAYLTKPVDAALLVDQLDSLNRVRNEEPYRVLIVDDQPLDAALYASALDGVGMITHIVGDPAFTLQALRDFNPELILLDMYMPKVSGEELARVIRQQAAYVSVPLVFLSGEIDTDKQLAAMRCGGDDFLTKPIDLQHLIASVTTRARRYRSLRSYMQRDSLTGLLNHTKSKEFLDVEIARAEREGRPLSFAMVDIDHFKRVNDTHGHPVGDRVIKSLARLLQQRLRRSDLIGRYGGEEFAVILSNTSGETATRVMDELREAFSRIRHQAGGTEFTATLSCGVAELRAGMSGNELANEADKALYQAKHRGRNQVVLA